MKRVILLVDGLNDLPQAALQGRTPLEVACTPALDRIAQHGRVGVVAHPPVWSDARFEFLYVNGLGLPPQRRFPPAGPLAAQCSRLDVSPNDQVYCASFVSIWEDELADPDAGGLSPRERGLLLNDLRSELTDLGARLVPGIDDELFLVLDDAGPHAPPTLSPHFALGESLINVVPQGPASKQLLDVMDCSMRFLADHDVNRVRSDLGENPAHLLWPWGGGVPIAEADGAEENDRAVIGSNALFLGVGQYLGWRAMRAERASDPQVSWKALLAKLDLALLQGDVAAVHSPELLRVAVMGTLEDRVASLESLDLHLVQPILERLEKHVDHRLLVLSTVGVQSEQRLLIPEAVPFAATGTDLEGVRGYPFHESAARSSDLKPKDAAELFEFFLGHKAPVFETYRRLTQSEDWRSSEAEAEG